MQRYVTLPTCHLSMTVHFTEDDKPSPASEKKSDMPRPYKCTECNKRFGQKGIQNEHSTMYTLIQITYTYIV